MDTTQNICDFSFYMEIMKNDFLNVTYEMQRPSVLYKPWLQIDGNQWCALYGKDLQSGVAGFGDTPALAMTNFDKAWHELRVKEAIK